MNAQLEELRILEQSYVPGPEASDLLSETTVIPIIAPTAVGKTTCIKWIADGMSDFDCSLSFTTRDQRADETNSQYRFLPHDSNTIADITQKAHRGELIQFAVHPTTDFVYDSEAIDYSAPFVMVDVLSSAVKPLRCLPAESLIEINLVCEPQLWTKRFNARQLHVSEKKKTNSRRCEQLRVVA